jgi:hypothetical protein
MPYPTNADLPAPVGAHLPDHAQGHLSRVVQSRLRRACERITAGGSGAPDRLGAVKRSYVKAGENWVRRHP